MTTSKDSLKFEKILDRNNMNKASKKGKKTDRNRSKPVEMVEMSNEEKGKVRILGIPIVVDQVVQQEIPSKELQCLMGG